MSRSLRIGIVCYPSLGGSGVVATETAIGLASRGHQVHLIASSRPARLSKSHEGFVFHEVSVPEYPLFEQAPYALALATKMVEVSRQHRLDLLQHHYAVPHATSAYLARQMLAENAPAFVASLHGTDVTKVGADPAYRELTRFCLECSAGMTVPSEFLKQEAVANFGLAPERIEVLANFVDASMFVPSPAPSSQRLQRFFDAPSEGPVLVHVSNFRAVKRPGDLPEVLLRVRRHLNARLLLVGVGPEFEATKALAGSMGLLPHMAFVGRRAEFVEELKDADGFLLTSESESFGLAALESLSAGVPVFAYRVGGLPEVVTPEVGRLAPAFDLDALASSIVEVLSDNVLHDSMRQASRAHVLRDFQLEPALDRWENYFRRIVERKTR